MDRPTEYFEVSSSTVLQWLWSMFNEDIRKKYEVTALIPLDKDRYLIRLDEVPEVFRQYENDLNDATTGDDLYPPSYPTK